MDGLSFSQLSEGGMELPIVGGGYKTNLIFPIHLLYRLSQMNDSNNPSRAVTGRYGPLRAVTAIGLHMAGRKQL
ncbi:hypothetical protein [Marinobacter sp.]|uniref:hypothetical protein n=1 Tax=Marinobacter sp. TaxID=50741 RepID=UPI003A8E25D5